MNQDRLGKEPSMKVNLRILTIVLICLGAFLFSGCSNQSSGLAGSACQLANQISSDGQYRCDAKSYTWLKESQSGQTITTSDETPPQETVSTLFRGKCEQNQQWLGNLEFSLMTRNWQSVYDLTSHLLSEDYWGLGGDSAIFTAEEEAEWSVGMGFLARSVIEGNYDATRTFYEKLLPLISRMDLACGVTTGETGLTSTILP